MHTAGASRSYPSSLTLDIDAARGEVDVSDGRRGLTVLSLATGGVVRRLHLPAVLGGPVLDARHGQIVAFDATLGAGAAGGPWRSTNPGRAH